MRTILLGQTTFWILAILATRPAFSLAQSAPSLRDQAVAAMKRASEYFAGQVASHGGYVYHYDLELDRRWGEGEATRDQIWVQPPGTPSVGLAYLDAFDATGDPFYLQLAHEVAHALIFGQLRSGGWTNCIDFDPNGQRVAQYRGRPRRGKNNSSLDDGQTQTAIRFMIRADAAFHLKNPAIHESAQTALASLLAAQFPNGGFPQVWTGPVQPHPPLQANYPGYDWRTEGRIKEYWTLYTLNDNVAVHVAQVLQDAHKIYGQERHFDALKRLGNFLLQAQMPPPQPAWAQQYNFDMQPAWARRFEPPAISGHESQAVIGVLMDIYEATGQEKYLRPVPAALDYLQNSTLADGQLARYYELQSNRPLYMTRNGDRYTLTYDDANLPGHYSWKTRSKVPSLRRRYERLTSKAPQPDLAHDPSRSEQVLIGNLIDTLDDQGRWVSTATGERLVGQAKFAPGERYLSSAVFHQNLSRLARYVSDSAPKTSSD